MAVIKHYNAHPFSKLFPKLGKEEFLALEDSIRAHGQEEPIVLYNGKILDGRNRYMACYSAGIEPTVVDGEFESDKEALDYVIIANVTRRHLDKSQRAMVGNKFRAEYDALAEVRKKAGQKKGGEDSGKGQVPGVSTGNLDARDEIGKAFSVGGKLMDQARAVAEASPEEEARVLAGETTVGAAYKRVQPEAETKALYVAEYEGWFKARAAYVKATEKLIASNKKANKAAKEQYEGEVKRFGKASRALVKIFRGGK